MPRGLGAVAASLLLTAILTLAACSSSNRGVDGSVGVGNGVALITSNDVTQLIVGQTLSISAAVTNDVNNEGVTWSLQQGAALPNGSPLPQGALSNQTATSVLFTAPTTTFAGETSATITAVSKANPIYYSQVTIVTLGTEQFDSATLFPANVNVAYAASFSVSGGTQPFTSGRSHPTLPAPYRPDSRWRAAPPDWTPSRVPPLPRVPIPFTLQAEDATNWFRSRRP
jgi:hypothetical protein